MPEDELSLQVRQIEPGDKLTGLSLGAAEFVPLKIFLQRDAKKYQERSLARTYAAFDPNGERPRIAAYITLVCGEVVVGDGDPTPLPETDVIYRYQHYPAIKIARLAVDTRYRGLKLGSQLVDLALGIAKDIICPAVGCRFAVVDSKKSAVEFYAKAGFTLLDTEANRDRSEPIMFIDLQKAAT